MWEITSGPWDFSTTSWGVRTDVHSGCVRVWGSGKGIRIANCLFEHVFFPYFDGALDFLRIAQGTLSDADTAIEELYTWEFDGPQIRGFTGRKRTGARNAGAVEFAP
jgi:hypothetical protein